MKYVNNPNLPESRVGVVAINSKAYTAIDALDRLNIKTVKIEPDLRMPVPVNSHADLQLLHIGEKKIFVQNEHLCTGELNEFFKTVRISSIPGNKYPDDVRLNCAFIGKYLICNIKTIAREILDYAYNNDMSVINVNQGYTRCSVCIINKNTIITDDESIFTATGKILNDVLFVSKGSIRLNGYNYGFIGGCCGKIDKDKIAFNGAIESHKDCNAIIDFLSKHSVECVELDNKPLEDIGGILPLMEYT